MAHFAQCAWPLWRVDDLTLCFQQDYLQILFPLLLVFLSVIRLSCFGAARALARHGANAYQPLRKHDSNQPDVLPLSDPSSDSESDDPLLEINGGRPALAKTKSCSSIPQDDMPLGQRLSPLVEEVALLGLVVVHAVALSPQGHDATSRGLLAAVVGLVVWSYALTLASLRLVLGGSRWRSPRLWSHTAAIYGFMWLFGLLPFRSVIIHPTSRLDQVLVFLDFALASLLFGIVMTTRNGKNTDSEDGITPSDEPFVSLFSLATFSWVDAIVYSGWKRTMELEHVWDLLPQDKASTVISEYRKFKKTASLSWHLLRFFKGMLLWQCFLACLAGLFTFAPTLLLKAILQYVEHPDQAPRNVVWLYVIALPVVDTVRSYADGMALWIGRKICIRVRAIIVGDIYAKALRRKAAAGRDKVLLEQEKNKTGRPGKEDDSEEYGTVARIKASLGIKKRKARAQPIDAEPAASGKGGERDGQSVGQDEQANLGTIINLMSVDSFKISGVTAYLHFLIAAAPTQLIVCVILLWQVMGLSAIPGLIVMIFLLPVNYYLARGFNITSKNIMAATDKRINVTNEVLQNIRIIKYFAWEERFGQIIGEKRDFELNALRSRFILWACAVAIWNSVPVLITFFSFLVYTLIEKKPLYPSIAFTAISLFMLLRVPLDQLGDMFAHVQEAKVSIDRVEEFLDEEETGKFDQLGADNVDEHGIKRIGLRDATLIRGGRGSVAEDGARAFQLLDMDVDFKIGKLNIIVGPTGSGKTSLLMGLLGEMTLLQGNVYCPGGRSREDVPTDPETGLADTVAYVAQTAWLVNANIRDNILFAAPYDEQRYRDVIVACAIERDLETFDHGDETLVGEKGISLSGGQKQRISLARALYSNSAHVLIDDCFSAVDAHTAQWIFSNCIKGPLMKNRTCILVTHNVQLCAPAADHIVSLDNGRIAAQGSALDVISGILGEDVQRAQSPSACASRLPSRVPSSIGDETLANCNYDSAKAAGGRAKSIKSRKPTADVMGESKASGAVKWPVMKLYLQSMGPWWFWIVTLIVFNLQQLSAIGTNVWVRAWSNQYVAERQGAVSLSEPSYYTYKSRTFIDEAWASAARAGGWPHAGQPLTQAYSTSPQTPLGTTQVNVAYYLTGLAIIGAGGALAAFIRDIWIFFGSLTASRRLHDQLMTAVTRAKFKFFDVTPLGQLMNRFSKDLEALDQEIAPTAIGVMTCALALVVTIILIAVITPGFLIAAIFIAGLFYLVAAFYLRASRDLKRLESVQRSPLFQQFGETLSGMTTIRAYGDQRRFIRDNRAKINTQSRPFLYLWACNRWLAFRADAIGNLVALSAGVFIILSLDRIDAGATGISLSYALGFTENILWLVRLYGMNEQNMNAMERVKEYLDLEQEAPPVIEKARPFDSWPDKGKVEFIDYTTRYRSDLEPVLKGVSLKINAKEKVGIVGRTGAGKSSLALALFRALEAEKGRIMIDGVDIGKIGLRDLRKNITMVPQDPTLFMGTVRTNLDPFDQYTDDEVFEALRRVQLIGRDEVPGTTRTGSDTQTVAERVRDQWPGSPSFTTNRNIFLDLASPVSESGSNLSQGQRQLLCLARAMLRKPSVLVMDEATASIDYNTDSKIQETIRHLTGTVITIAHRLQTIVDYDRVLLLDQGQVMECGHPWELLSKEGGAFRSMCESSGELEVLRKAAKKKWDEGQLVDVTDG